MVTLNYGMDGVSALDLVASFVADGSHIRRDRFLEVLYASGVTRHWGASIVVSNMDVVLDLALFNTGELGIVVSRNGEVIDWRMPGGVANDR
jgi:hypothetical protein